jgi:hypothetical protein
MVASDRQIATGAQSAISSNIMSLAFRADGAKSPRGPNEVATMIVSDSFVLFLNTRFTQPQTRRD